MPLAILAIVALLALSGCNTTKYTQAELDAAWKAERQRMMRYECESKDIGKMDIREYKECERILGHD